MQRANNCSLRSQLFLFFVYFIMQKKDNLGRPKKEIHELRKKVMNVRFTYDEYIKIIKKKPSHLSDSAFIREILVDKKLVFLDYKILNNLIPEIRKVGRNVNQIAKKVNSSGSLDLNDSYILRSKISELNEIYYNILQTINDK